MTAASMEEAEPEHGRHDRSQQAGLGDLVRAYPWLPSVAGLVLVVLGGTFFSALAEQVSEGGMLLRLDQQLMGLVAAARPSIPVELFAVLTGLGDFLVVAPAAAAGAVALGVHTRSWSPFLLLTLATVGIALAVFLIKLIIARPRPNPAQAIIDADGYGFPSGHSSQAAAVYLMLAALIIKLLHSRWSRIAVLAAALLLILVTGFSRVVLGVHSPSDVVAGWTLGATWTLLLLSLWALGSYLPPLIDYLVKRAER